MSSNIEEDFADIIDGDNNEDVEESGEESSVLNKRKNSSTSVSSTPAKKSSASETTTNSSGKKKVGRPKKAKSYEMVNSLIQLIQSKRLFGSSEKAIKDDCKINLINKSGNELSVMLNELISIKESMDHNPQHENAIKFLSSSAEQDDIDYFEDFKTAECKVIRQELEKIDEKVERLKEELDLLLNRSYVLEMYHDKMRNPSQAITILSACLMESISAKF